MLMIINTCIDELPINSLTNYIATYVLTKPHYRDIDQPLFLSVIIMYFQNLFYRTLVAPFLQQGCFAWDSYILKSSYTYIAHTNKIKMLYNSVSVACTISFVSESKEETSWCMNDCILHSPLNGNFDFNSFHRLCIWLPLSRK